MSLFSRSGLGLALLLAALALTAATSGAEPVAHAARACHLSSSQQRGGLGATYTVNLRVHGTGCTTGKRVAKGFNTCRRHHRASHCRPYHFRCRESGVTRSPAQRSAKVRCTKGSRIVSWAYTQNL